MRIFKTITYFILLITTPTLIAYPQSDLPRIKFQLMNSGYQQETEE